MRAIVSLAAGTSHCRQPGLPSGYSNVAKSSRPSSRALIKTSIRLVIVKEKVRALPWMTTIRSKKHPISVSKMGTCAQVTWHMAWRLNYPETCITEKVHCSVKWTKRYPWSSQCLPLFSRVHRIKESTIPLRCRVYKMTRGTKLFGSGPKVSSGIGERIVQRTTVIKVCMTYDFQNGKVPFSSVGFFLTWRLLNRSFWPKHFADVAVDLLSFPVVRRPGLHPKSI